jgi:hypothetical protein
MRALTSVVVICVALAAAGCKKKNNPASPSTPAFRGEVNDSRGDTGTHQAFDGVSPDLVVGVVEVRGGNATFIATFADSTMSRATTSVQFALDIDQNVATGSQLADYNGIGIDLLVNMGSSAGGLTKVLEYIPVSARYTEVASANLTFGVNTMEATIPLSSLKNDDGQMSFKVVDSALIGNATFTGILDYMTDPGLPPGVVR